MLSLITVLIEKTLLETPIWILDRGHVVMKPKQEVRALQVSPLQVSKGFLTQDSCDLNKLALTKKRRECDLFS